MNNKIVSKIYQYTVVLEPAIEGGYIATVPAISGCVTQGENLEETMRMAKDAIEGCIAVLKDENQEIPTEPEGTFVTKISIPCVK